MINTILFVAVIVLMLILFALLVVILLEYRAKKSYDHYIMESGNVEEELSQAAKREEAEGGYREIERAIPSPREQERSVEEIVRDTVSEIEPQTANEPQESATRFKQFPQKESRERENNPAVEEILHRSYKPFTHDRLVETMGLSAQEADEFVLELIHQLEDAIVELDGKIEAEDFDEVEHITHGLKGAALNIGSGGVADILVDYNNEMKNGGDPERASAYQELLRRAVSDLKIEYSQVA
ncbi:uncharacterized conserved protein [Hydrogenimonas sp.]|nr:uncharacterized conserved protein [Hydrogenimonas sp.]